MSKLLKQRHHWLGDSLHPEYVADRYSDTKYFASNQSLIFMGPYLIDEAVSLSYKIEQRKVPLYGYNDQYYSAIASGRVMVSGQLVINYIDSSYLFLALFHAGQKLLGKNHNEVNDTLLANTTFSRTQQNIVDKMEQLKDNYDQYKSNPKTTRDIKKITQLIQSDPIAGKIVMQNLREQYWDKRKSTHVGNSLKTNLSYKQLSQWSGNGDGKFSGIDYNALTVRPDQMPPVNITVGHGDLNHPENSTYRVLKDVEFLDNSMVMTPVGSPQLESYSFIAKTIEY